MSTRQRRQCASTIVDGGRLEDYHIVENKKWLKSWIRIQLRMRGSEIAFSGIYIISMKREGNYHGFSSYPSAWFCGVNCIVVLIVCVLFYCRTSFKKSPKISGNEIDLYLLYVLVTAHGGWIKVMKSGFSLVLIMEITGVIETVEFRCEVGEELMFYMLVNAPL